MTVKAMPASRVPAPLARLDSHEVMRFKQHEKSEKSRGPKERKRWILQLLFRWLYCSQLPTVQPATDTRKQGQNSQTLL